MSTLEQQKCEACHIGAAEVSHAQAEHLMKQIPEWQMLTRDSVNVLERLFKFKNFKQALAFANKVGELAESEGHHPAILLEWGKVTVTWWTHAIKGLHKNDFICAAKTDKLFAEL